MARPALPDYTLLLAVGVLWGAQFSLNEIAIRSFGPLTVGAGRMVFGVIALSLVMAALAASRRRAAEPSAAPLVPAHQPWGLYAIIAVVEGIIPLVFIPWGQRTVDSAIAAIFLAMVPIFTLAMAPLFDTSERWTRLALLSVGLGFIGVLVLLAPDIEGNVLASLRGELLIVFATLCWAVGVILMRRIRGISPFLAIRNIFTMAAGPTTLLAVVIEQPWAHPVSLDSVLALLALGVFSGGIAYGFFLLIVIRAGPTFASLAGYCSAPRLSSI